MVRCSSSASSTNATMGSYSSPCTPANRSTCGPSFSLFICQICFSISMLPFVIRCTTRSCLFIKELQLLKERLCHFLMSDSVRMQRVVQPFGKNLRFAFFADCILPVRPMVYADYLVAFSDALYRIGVSG